jgi:O-antigen/teichoic acid export membrane protein
MSIFIDLGLNIYITRDLSRYPHLSKKYMGNIIPLKITLSTISFLGTIIILLILGYDFLSMKIILLFMIHYIFQSMGSLFNGVFQAFSKTKYQAVGTIISSTLLLIGTILLIFFNLGLVSVAIVYLFGSLITLIYLHIKAKDEIGTIKIQGNFNFWKKALVKSIPFGITGIFTTIYFTIDMVMLSFMVGDVAVGIYSSAYKVVTVFFTIYAAYNYVVFPLMSKFYINSKDLLKISYEKSLKYLFMMMLPIAIGVSFYSNDLIVLICGDKFILAGTALKILIWNVLFVMINGAASSLLNSSGKEMVVTKINGIACLINIIFNILLIYYLSYIGASIAAVITGILIFILINYVIIKGNYKPSSVLVFDIIKISLIGIILSSILFITNLNLLLAIPFTIIIYIAGIYLLNVLDQQDKFILKEILGK